MTDGLEGGRTWIAAEVELQPLELDPASVVTGTPRAAWLVLDTSADERVVRGIWQLTEGTVTDVEEDELFVVLFGSATVEVADGPTLELRAGVTGTFERGTRTRWHVHETLRKVFQITSAEA